MGGLGSDLNIGGGERGIGGIMLSFSEWVFLNGEGWELVLEFWAGIPLFWAVAPVRSLYV